MAISSARIVRVVSATAGVSIFLVWGMPLILLPFVDRLPYLQTRSFVDRLPYSFAFFALSALVLRCGMTDKGVSTVRRLTLSTKKAVVGGVLCFLMAVSTTAWLSGNIFGPLVWMFPGVRYQQTFIVENIAGEGSKHKAVSLILRDVDSRLIYFLTLSNKDFNYSGIRTYDRLVLIGKRSEFGVLVQSVETVAQGTPRSAGLEEREVGPEAASK